MMKRIFAAILVMLLTVCAAFCEEDLFPMCDFELDAYGGTLNVSYVDGSVDETGGWSFSIDLSREGMTVGDVLADFDVAGLEAFHENDAFEGWLVFEVAFIPDEYGFEESVYTLISDAPITTEALLATPVTETDIVFAAKWAGIPAEEYFQISEDDAEVFYMTAATLYANGGVMLMHSEEEDYESSLSVGTMDPGQPLNEVLELDSLLSVTREGYEFAGWTVYDVSHMESGEEIIEADGALSFAIWDDWFTTLLDYTLYAEGLSTDELKDITGGDTDYFIVAEWV